MWIQTHTEGRLRDDTALDLELRASANGGEVYGVAESDTTEAT